MVVDNREGDLQHDYYRPAAVQRLRAGVDAQRTASSRGITSSPAARGTCIARIRAAAVLDRDLRQLRRPRAVGRAARSRSAADAHPERATALRQSADRRRHRRLARARRTSSTPSRSKRRSTSWRRGRSEARSICGWRFSARRRMCRRARTIRVRTTRRACGACCSKSSSAAASASRAPKAAPAGSRCITPSARTARTSSSCRSRRGSNGQKRVTIHKVAAVADVGQPVNLSMLEAQMQGGIIDGIGAAFFGEVPIEQRPRHVAQLRRLPPDPHARSAARRSRRISSRAACGRPASASRRCRRSRRRWPMRSRR